MHVSFVNLRIFFVRPLKILKKLIFNYLTLLILNLKAAGKDYNNQDFKIIWDCKTGQPITIHLVAPTKQDKAAWISDISQVFSDFFIKEDLFL